MNIEYSLMSYAFMGVRLIFMALVFVALLVAWKKYRHFGFGILAGWALASGSWSLLQNGWFHFARNFMAGGNDYGQLVVLSNLFAVVALHALLLAGVALLAWIPIKPQRAD